MNYTRSSCEDIYNSFTETQNKSWYYRMKENNKYQWTYCNMSIISGDFIFTCAGVGGGWRRIVNINISAGDDCPGEWRKATQSGFSFCRVASDSSHKCSSASFSTNGIRYQRVCRRARGYQKGEGLGMHGYAYNYGIDRDYVSGLSITYSNNLHQHIWAYASGRGEKISQKYSCPCTSKVAQPPSYVGNNYYCESNYLVLCLRNDILFQWHAMGWSRMYRQLLWWHHTTLVLSSAESDHTKWYWSMDMYCSCFWQWIHFDWSTWAVHSVANILLRL